MTTTTESLLIVTENNDIRTGSIKEKICNTQQKTIDSFAEKKMKQLITWVNLANER